MRLNLPRVRLPRLPRFWVPRPGGRVSRSRRRARAALAWAPAGWIITITCAWVFAEIAVPAVTDPDYHYKIETTRSAIAANPGRPLGVVLGSSRMMWAFHPELVPGDSLVWANASHLGAGPILQRVLLARLLRDGIRPDVLVLEVMPPYFVREDTKWIGRILTLRDLFLARRYTEPCELEFWYLVERQIRVRPLGGVLDPYRDIPPPLKVGGHMLLQESTTAEDRAKRTESQRRQHGAQAAGIRASPGADRAFRDTIRTATDAGIRIVILRSPEGSVFRGWYDPDRLARFDDHIRAVAAEFRVPVIDARDWLPDEEFYDYHHTLRPGAVKFTRRLVDEVARAMKASGGR